MILYVLLFAAATHVESSLLFETRSALQTELSRCVGDTWEADEDHDCDTNTWDVSRVTNMSRLFYGAAAFDGNLSDWDVSGVTDMSQMFYGATQFNGDLSDWEVAHVTNMSQMFYGATAFSGDLYDWEVANVTNMSRMFYGATAFNGDLSEWEVANVTDMSRMFYGATAFNQTLCGQAWVDKNSLRSRANISNTLCSCPVGHYLDAMVSACQLCPAGRYQDAHAVKTAQCKACPVGKYSALLGLTTDDQCTRAAVQPVATHSSTTSQLEAPAMLIALCIFGTLAVLVAMFVCPRRKKPVAYMAVQSEDVPRTTEYKPLKWVP